MQYPKKLWLAALLVLGLALVLLGPWQAMAAPAPQGTPPSYESTADHSKFEVLQQDFATGPDVTKACLSCHTEASQQVMHTTHWTWEYISAQGQVLGKKNVINNYCVAVGSNEPRCTSCHIGYGYTNKDFDFTNESLVDCLVCHDTTGTYKKFPAGAGHPAYEEKEFPPGSGKIWSPPDLTTIAQNVGRTSRQTCGACHFYGGGGDAVKHGDLDSTMANPPVDVDVHMSPDGEDMTCADCHTTWGHVVPGSRYDMNAKDTAGIDLPILQDGERVTCESCHGLAPMKDDILNQHVDRIACQTCHIPEFARGDKPTKMWWDWSKAGQKNPDGSAIVTKDENGWVTYDTKKGEFVWEKDVQPQYFWFNGHTTYQLTEPFDPNAGVVEINSLMGSPDDGQSRIYPFKVFRGVQPYDAVNNTLVVPHLFGKDENAYWKSYDWDKAIAAGMEYAGLEYSGQYDWVETAMYWPITHMVAPAEQAVQCGECHTRTDSRMDGIPGIYAPGHDYSKGLDAFGWGLAMLSLVGVVLHGGLRIAVGKK